jgi:predicted RNA-binding Zn-ribbon protein involved in translation (DUF1610 family)
MCGSKNAKKAIRDSTFKGIEIANCEWVDCPDCGESLISAKECKRIQQEALEKVRVLKTKTAIQSEFLRRMDNRQKEKDHDQVE